VRPLALLAGAIAALAVLAPSSALAHTEIVATSPKAGSTVERAPGKVTVTFSAQIRSGTIVVRNGSGRLVSKGSGGRDPANVKRLRVALAAGLGSGRYTVRWTVVGADGHEQRGSFSFRVA
jgi:methionine-rich copper-binding protein CopC